ncbi:MAG: hypothetical protein L3J88_10035 [Gammaproteobacteria bacterium]|nr:hypothetical protein [Gammaproteobacteria bacterium]
MSRVALFEFSFSAPRHNDTKSAKEIVLNGFVCNIPAVGGLGFCTFSPDAYKKLCFLCTCTPVPWIAPPAAGSTTP